MNPGNFFAELKRRNVYKVAVAYAVIGWLLMQIASQIFPFFQIPNWAVRLVVLLDNHDTGTLVLLVGPLLRGLRDDPRYKNLLAKPGLPETS